MRRDFPTLRDGDLLQPRHLNLIYRELERQAKVSGVGIDVSDTAAGVTYSSPDVPAIWAKITSGPDGSGGYPWKEVLRNASGVWVDSGLARSATEDPAYEINNNRSIGASEKVVELTRSPTSGVWLFDDPPCQRPQQVPPTPHPEPPPPPAFSIDPYQAFFEFIQGTGSGGPNTPLLIDDLAP
jgi:hypothetical protein